MDLKWGRWIDALQVSCSDGSGSEWFGNGSHDGTNSTATFGGGLTNLSAFILDFNAASYPTIITLFGYDEGKGYPDGITLGPYGEEQESLVENYSENPETSGCGTGSYAVGVSVYESETYVYGIQLHCRQINGSSCPAPKGLLVPGAGSIQKSTSSMSPSTTSNTEAPTALEPAIIPDGESSCNNFSAEMIPTNFTNDGTTLTGFKCEEYDAYLSRMDIKWGWWIDAIRFGCSDGSASAWFGNGSYDGINGTVIFGGGLTNISAYILDFYDNSYPTILTLYGYDAAQGYPGGMVLGPFGEKQDSQTATYSDEPQTSECGVGGYAVGVSIYEDDIFVHGIQLHCREINSTSCPTPEGLLVPTVGAIPTPTPVMSLAPPNTLEPAIIPDGESSCNNFSAEMIPTNFTNDGTTLTGFKCEEYDAYLSRMDIKWGWWIDAIRFGCSDGSASAWFGNGSYDGINGTVIFGGGLTNISAYILDFYDNSYPTILTLYGYDAAQGYPGGMVLGPFGEKQDSQTATYSDEPQTSECGVGGYAVGVSIYEDDIFVHGIQLHCREINSTSCPTPEGLLVPTVGAIPTPTPVMSLAPPNTLEPAIIPDGESSCNNFSAEMIPTNFTNDGTTLTGFKCEEYDAYLSRMDIKWGWWIDAIRFGCSDGSASAWFGNGSYDGINGTVIFGGGLTNISAYILDFYDNSYPTILTLYGYDAAQGYPGGMVLGPFGEKQDSQTATYSDEPQTSECGVGGYAVGVSIYEDDIFVHGIQLHCREINSTSCPTPEGLLVPTVGAIPTPTPVMSLAPPNTLEPAIIPDGESSCNNFSAEMIPTNFTNDGTTLTGFKCEEYDAYLSRMDIKWGWWIDAIRFGCSDGSASAWFGNGSYDGINGTVIFGGGLTNISAYILDFYDNSYPTILTLYGYDAAQGYPGGMVLGPFGEKQDSQTATYSDEPQTSECGVGGYAVGVSIYEDDIFVHGIQLHCRQINSTSCPAPEGLLVSTVGAIPTPTPVMSSAPPDTLTSVETWAPMKETDTSIEPIEYNGTRAATMGSDDSVILARANLAGGASSAFSWSATKFSLSVNKTWLYPLWEWEATTAQEWFVTEVVMGHNGDVAMIGGNESHQAVTKLDKDGKLDWRYETESCGSDAVVVMDDGSVVVSGRAIIEDTQEFSFASCKLYANGTLAWRWQTGTTGEDSFHSAALAHNNSVVLAGHTYGNWMGSVGDGDFAAVKLDSEGNELWRWQEGSADFDSFLGAATADNGSVVLVGVTYGNWSGINQGGGDFAAVKLDSDGFVSWRWQNGTEGEDYLAGAAMDEDGGTVFLGGSTTGGWGNRQADRGYDFAGVQLDLAKSNEIRRWQNGTLQDDVVIDVSGGFGGLVLLAGRTKGSWSEENLDADDSVVIVVDISPQQSLHTPSPSMVFPTASSRTSGSGGLSTTVIATITASSVVAGVALVAVLLLLITRKKCQSTPINPAVPAAGGRTLGSQGVAAEEQTDIQPPSYESVMRSVNG